MKMFRLTFAAAAAAMILVAGIAAACGDKATTADKKSCCGKGAAQTASCSKDASATAGHAGCSKGAAQTASASGCAKSEAKGCCAKAQNQMAKAGDMSDVKTCTFRPGEVAFKGTVLCNHCDLHNTETCQTMFRTENGCVFTLAGDNVKQMKDEAGGGKAIV